MTQDELFLDGEADAWFSRNAALMRNREDAQSDPVLGLLHRYNIRPREVLDIGASNGYRTHWLVDLYGSVAVAIDPSAKAVKDGRKRYPAVVFDVGVASQLPYTSGRFDCVIVSGVFCWLDRRTLLRAIAEADRVLQDGGYLLISDFNPINCERVRYHHRDDVAIYTYKQDYSAIFRASGCYEQLAMMSFELGSSPVPAAIDPAKRFGATLLRKDLTSGYPTTDYVSLRNATVG